MPKTNIFIKLIAFIFQRFLLGNPEVLKYINSHRYSTSRKDATINLLKVIFSELKPIINHLDKNDGWFALDKKYIDFVERLDVNWWKYYKNERMLNALMGITILQYLNIDLITNSPNKEFTSDLVSFFSDEDESTFRASESEITIIQQFLKNGTLNSKSFFAKRKIKNSFTAFLAVSHNYLAFMVHKKTMCQLVAEAEQGDDESFVQAVQIDRTVLQLEYFKKRILRAQLGNEWQFLDTLGEHIKRKVFSKKLKYPMLWLTFYILDQEGLLELPREELLNECNTLGVYDSDDLNSFKNRLADYKKSKGT